MNDEFEKKAKKWGISYNEYIRGKVGMKMVKLIAIDLDGTLLDKGKYISDKNIEAIRFAQKSGIMVVIATGRANFDAQNLMFYHFLPRQRSRWEASRKNTNHPYASLQTPSPVNLQ